MSVWLLFLPGVFFSTVLVGFPLSCDVAGKELSNTTQFFFFMFAVSPFSVVDSDPVSSFVLLPRSFNSISEDDSGPIMNIEVNPFFTMTMELRQQQMSGTSLEDRHDTETYQRAKKNWRLALRKLADREDPWAKFRWDKIPTERATRHRYNPLTKKWKQDDVVVRMESKSFGRGAMRECFRL